MTAGFLPFSSFLGFYEENFLHKPAFPKVSEENCSVFLLLEPNLSHFLDSSSTMVCASRTERTETGCFGILFGNC